MPPNIFATTGTNVSVVFIDKTKTSNTAILVDASKLGKEIREGDNQKTILEPDDENSIINAINNNESIEGFSIEVEIEKIKGKKYSFGAGQYFETKIEYVKLSSDEFDKKIQLHKNNLEKYFGEGKKLQNTILNLLERINEVHI